MCSGKNPVGSLRILFSLISQTLAKQKRERLANLSRRLVINALDWYNFQVNEWTSEKVSNDNELRRDEATTKKDKKFFHHCPY